MTLPSPLCLIRWLWRSLTAGVIVDGCDYVESEVHHGCWVHVLRCRSCGGVSITWGHGEPTEHVAPAEPCCAKETT